jgi:aconitate hydratase
MNYQATGTPLIVLGGIDYGMGSSRDWAARGPFLLGVKAVITSSFERIHRSNLGMMGVRPRVFKDGENSASLGLDGTEAFNIEVDDTLQPRQTVRVTATHENGTTTEFETVARVDTPIEVEYLRNGGILHYVLRQMAGT